MNNIVQVAILFFEFVGVIVIILSGLKGFYNYVRRVPDMKITLAQGLAVGLARADELRAMAIDALDIVNAKRAENGLAALNWSNGLESCAMVRATEAASKFSHTRPNGKDWYTVNSELMWGENLAKGYDSAQSVVDAWMASPTHAANILAGDFTTCSIAVYETNGKLYFAQEFGY